MKQVETLAEILDVAKQQRSSSTLFLSQKETEESSITLGDEDTGAETSLRIEVLIKGVDESYFYKEELHDPRLYEETIRQFHELNVEIVSEEKLAELKTEN